MSDYFVTQDVKTIIIYYCCGIDNLYFCRRKHRDILTNNNIDNETNLHTIGALCLDARNG